MRAITTRWSSRWFFVMAATGSAVGLGNIWKFPYMAGEYGGGIFILLYLLCVMFIGLPTLIAEVMIGRCAHTSPVTATAKVAVQSGGSRKWWMVGMLGLLSAFLLLSFYAVIAGWSLAFIWFSLSGQLSSPSQVGSLFDDFLANPGYVILWQTVFMIITAFIVGRGVKAGIEKFIRFLVPGLFIILLILVIWGSTTEGFKQAVSFVFAPDWSNFSTQTLLAAMGQAFFTLSVATASMLIYGAYLDKDSNIPKNCSITAALDVSVAILAALAIFPIVFSYGLHPGEGETLAFRTLPLAFSSMPYGQIVGLSFFILLLLAALSSAISMVEPIVAWITEQSWLNRAMATWCVTFAIWCVGILSALSFNTLADAVWLGIGTPFSIIASSIDLILLPIGGLLIAILAGWRMKKNITRKELIINNKLFSLWYIAVRYVVPCAVLAIIISGFYSMLQH